MRTHLHFRKPRIKFSLLFAALALLCLVSHVEPVSALSDAQLKLHREGIYYFDAEVQSSCAASPSTGSNVPDSGGATGGFTSDQEKSFLREPLTSTWNISDSTIESWFVQNMPSYIKAYPGIGDIHAVTQAIKAAGVSPVYFYTYAKSENGVYGDFINHQRISRYPGLSDSSSAADRAAAAAKVLVATSQSNSKLNDGYYLSWWDFDHAEYKFVPAEVIAGGEADFASMPAGSIGRSFLPNTAAAVWGVYYPAGLSQSVNHVQNYGDPVSVIMQWIKDIGGDPLEGGATISAGSSGCTGGVTGEGMQKAINFAVAIANNDGYGYDQGTRATGLPKWQSDPNCTSQCGSFDCSSFISAALTLAGYFKTNPNFNTGGEASALTSAGFKQIAGSATTSDGLLPGDILLASGHTEMYIGNNQLVGAHKDENGRTVGGKTGDQTGKEISVGPFYTDSWIGVFRAQN